VTERENAMGMNEIDIRRGTATGMNLGWMAEWRLVQAQRRADEIAVRAALAAGHNTGVQATAQTGVALDLERITENRISLAEVTERRGLQTLGKISEEAARIPTRDATPDVLVTAQVVGAADRMDRTLSRLSSAADDVAHEQMVSSAARWGAYENRYLQ
jgi:hypothetical protein